ncbi:hypothetical protein EG68_04679 [Paragonimus skrjabini miyazakii]|uniref:Uncharacterized protein n=1 Tax=Paragonimus skrjabini miyazakii TaxID=59628 RepID=A0A8S9YXA3_9TREM|nr:hypothetical protein EG68_04679 [Paragonimus skrjabini miyazakii]
MLCNEDSFAVRQGGPVTDLIFDNTSQLIATVTDISCELAIWDCRSQKRSFIFKEVHRTTPTSCRFTPDNRCIITTSTDGSTKCIDIRKNRTLITLRDHKHAVSSASVTKDGKLLVTTSWDRTILLYDLQTGNYRVTGPQTLTGSHNGSINCSDIDDNGKRGMDKLIVIWDLCKGHRAMYLKGHEDWVLDVGLSTDDRDVLSASKVGYDLSDIIYKRIKPFANGALNLGKECQQEGTPIKTAKQENAR